MKKTLKRLGALALALALCLVLALSSVAWAADDDGNLSGDGIAGNTSGVWAAKDTPVVQTSPVVTIYKELTAYNPDPVTIKAPTITYTYKVTAGEAGKEIYDNEANHATNTSAHAYTKAGILTGLKVNDTVSASGTVGWTPADELSASASGEKNTKTLTIDFSGVTFTGAGVYRYVISESAATYVTSGVVDGTINGVRYLDVYVKDGSTVGTYDIYGFVLFCNNNNIDGSDTPSLDTPAEAVKTEGFVSGTQGTADQYYTYNLTITKELVGDQAMNSHKFPFSLDFVNTTVTGNVLPIVTGTGTVPTLTAGDINGMDQDGTNLKLANGETAIFTGIPVGTTVTINEKNDVTGTVYTTSTSGGTTNQASGLALNWDTWTNDVSGWTTVTALQKTANAHNVAADANMTVTFTNTLLTISPTGVVLRVAPYILILCAGVVLLVLSRRRRMADDEA